MDFASVDLSVIQWTALIASAVMIGLSKTGIPGVSILAVPLMAMGFEAKSSVGIVLPMLMCGDVIASIYYRRWAQWGYLLKLMPWTVVGIVAGYFLMDRISGNQLRPLIGGLVILMLALKYALKFWNSKKGKEDGSEFFNHWLFSAVFGFATGVTTMLANAAGPVIVLYFLSCGLFKDEFIGTRAWFCFIMNWLKVPFHLSLGIMNFSSLMIDAAALPFLIAGSFAGIFILKRIPQGVFAILAQVFAFLAALRLLFG